MIEPGTTDDLFWMREALALAREAAENGEVPVGAVVVMNGQCVGRGHNAPVSNRDPSAHAEILALREAAIAVDNYRLPGATLYSTKEPCPMCAGAIIQARIERVVYAAADERWGGAGSVYDILTAARLNHRVNCCGGLLAADAIGLLQDFFRARRKR